ncbi:Hypothetical protein I5071_52290 [Sandaracinus amylolyticus]|nr:Hypothetical protein I5071_52290 [Sandaracinus amylolyticus]
MKGSRRMLARAMGVLLVLGIASGCGSGGPAVGAVSAELSVTTSGSVRDSEGTPIADARIDFLQGGIPQGSVTTGPDGTWSVAIEEGTYDVVITPPPESVFVAQTLSGQVIAEGTTLQIVLVAASMVHYTAQLRDREGAPLVEQWVCLAGLVTSTCGITDAAGDVRLAVLPGSYDVGVQIADRASSPLFPEHVSFSRPVPTLTADTTETFTIQNRALTGIVVDPDGNPVPNASVAAFGDVAIPDASGRFSDWARTDASGRFALGVMQATVELHVAPEPGSGVARTQIWTPVDGDTDIVVTLSRPVLWTGHLRDRDGAGIPRVTVCLRGSNSSCGATDDAGDVQLEVVPGSYSIGIDGIDEFSTPQLPPQVMLTLPGPTLSADTTEWITIENRVITGVVVDADGNPVPNARLGATGHPTIPDASGEFSDAASTDASGRFALRTLQGALEIRVEPEVGSVAGPTSISMIVDDDTDIVITLPRTVVWTGQLRDRHGAALVGANVCLIASTGTCGFTDGAGDVRLAVVPGTYSVSIDSNDPAANPQLPEITVLSLPGPTLTADATQTIVIEDRELVGVVLDVDGNPVPNASLIAGGWITVPDGWGWFRETSQTDASGRFAMSALEGTIEVHVSPDPASGLSAFGLQGVVVDGDTSLAVLLQFLTDSVEASVGAGETVSTDHEGDGAVPADPVETSLTSPVPGTVTIREAPITETAPLGYAFLTQQVNVTAPASTADAPLVITFAIDGSRIPLGQDETTLQLFASGAKVPACTGAPGVAAPDPCVASRTRDGDDVVVTALTSHAGAWNVGVRRIGDADQDGLLDDVDVCPADAEDPDGFLDDDGCPDLDDDGDGVPDAIDLCAHEPEDLDGFEDDDGCAEEGPDTGTSCADLDGDGRVTVRDLVGVARAMGSSLGERRYRDDADLDRDGDVDVADLHLVRAQRGTACTSSP